MFQCFNVSLYLSIGPVCAIDIDVFSESLVIASIIFLQHFATKDMWTADRRHVMTIPERFFLYIFIYPETDG